jgi:hypothetical protein
MDPTATERSRRSPDPTTGNVGIALSGGGHRATAWGMGVLGAVIASGLHRRTVSISSVSGGSITNAAVASAGDFRQVDDVDQLAEWIAPTLRVVAIDGLFLPGAPTRRYVATTLIAMVAAACALLGFVVAATSVGRGHPAWPYATIGVVVGLVGGWIVALLITDHLVVALGVGAVLGGAVGAGVASAVRDLTGVAAVSVVVLTIVVAGVCLLRALRSLARRGPAVADALARQLSPDGAPGPFLRDITSSVDHVFCTTDVESAQPMFFAPKFIYGFRHGLAATATSDLTVAQVTQASAAVPPGFPPVTFAVPEFRRSDATGTAPDAMADRTDAPGVVRLSDGGVYDNLGDEWEGGFGPRAAQYPELLDVQPPADLLVVSDASPRFGWRPFTARGLVAPEVHGVLRTIDLLWAGTTTRRRHDLYERFRPGSQEPNRCSGVLVMIDDSPVEVCRAALELGDPEVEARAEAAIDFLLDQRGDDAWQALSERCARVPTTLGPLTVPVTLELIELAYMATMVALHVFLGVGALHAFPRRAFAGQLP